MGESWGLADRCANQVGALGQDDEAGSRSLHILQRRLDEICERDHTALGCGCLKAEQARKVSSGSEAVKHVHLGDELALRHLKIWYAAAVRGLGDRCAAYGKKFPEACPAVRRVVSECSQSQ